MYVTTVFFIIIVTTIIITAMTKLKAYARFDQNSNYCVRARFIHVCSTTLYLGGWDIDCVTAYYYTCPISLDSLSTV